MRSSHYHRWICNEYRRASGATCAPRMANKLDDALRGVTPDGLRQSESLRVETKRMVDDAIKSLPSLDM